MGWWYVHPPREEEGRGGVGGHPPEAFLPDARLRRTIGETGSTQRAQYPLTKDYTLTYKGLDIMIEATSLNS